MAELKHGRWLPGHLQWIRELFHSQTRHRGTHIHAPELGARDLGLYFRNARQCALCICISNLCITINFKKSLWFLLLCLRD